MNRIINTGDTVYFKWGKSPLKATITALNFKENAVTVQVSQPLPRGMEDAVRDVAIDELVFTGRKEISMEDVVSTCLCIPKNCKHED